MNHSFIPLMNDKNASGDLESKIKNKISRSLEDVRERKLDFSADHLFICSEFVYIATKSSDQQPKILVYRYHLANDDLAPVRLPITPQIKEISHLEVFMEHYLLMTERGPQNGYVYIYHMLKEQMIRFSIDDSISKVVINNTKQKMYFNDRNALKAVDVSKLFTSSLAFVDLDNGLISTVYSHDCPITSFEVGNSEKEFLILDDKGRLQLYSEESMTAKDVFELKETCKRYSLLHKSQRIIVELENQIFGILYYSNDLPFINPESNSNASPFSNGDCSKCDQSLETPRVYKSNQDDSSLTQTENDNNPIIVNDTNAKSFANFEPFLGFTYKCDLVEKLSFWNFFEDENLLICQNLSDLIFLRVQKHLFDDSPWSLPLDNSISQKALFHSQTKWLVFTDVDNNLYSLQLGIYEYWKLGIVDGGDLMAVSESLNRLYVCQSPNLINIFDLSQRKLIAVKTYPTLSYSESIIFMETGSQGFRLYFGTTEGLICCVREDKEDVFFNLNSNSEKKIVYSLFKFHEGDNQMYVGAKESSTIKVLSFDNDEFRIERTISMPKDFMIRDFCLSPKHNLLLAISYDKAVAASLNETSNLELRELNINWEEIDKLLVDNDENFFITLSSSKITTFELPSLRIHSVGKSSESLIFLCQVDYGLLLTLDSTNQISLWTINDMTQLYSLQIKSIKEVINDVIYDNSSKILFVLYNSGLISMIHMNRSLKINFPQAVNGSQPFSIFLSHKYKEIYVSSDKWIGEYRLGSVISPVSNEIAITDYYRSYSDFMIADSFDFLIGIGDGFINYWQKSDFAHKTTIPTEDCLFTAIIPEHTNILLTFGTKFVVKKWIMDSNEIRPTSIIVPLEEKSKISSVCQDNQRRRIYLGNLNGRIYSFDYRDLDSNDTENLWIEVGSHMSAVRILRFFHKKQRLISCENNNILKVWGILNEQAWLIHSIEFPGKINFVEVSESYELLFIVRSFSILEALDLNTMSKFRIDLASGISSIRQIKIDEKASKELLFIIYNDASWQSYLTTYDIKSLFKLSFYEKSFIKELVNKEMTKEEFLKTFQKWKPIYMESFILQKYYNIYLLAAIYKQTLLFKKLYKEEKVAFEFNVHQINCLQYLLSSDKNLAQLKELLKFMNDHNAYSVIDNTSFNRLLAEHRGYGHKFLGKACQKMYLYDNDKLKIQLEDKFRHKIQVIQEFDDQYTKLTHKQLELDSQLDPRSIAVYNFHIQSTFDLFSDNSIAFLKAYAFCESDDFLLSPYRHIITQKWNKVYLFFWAQAALYWSHFIIYFIYLMMPTNLALFVTDMVLLTVLMAYESLSAVSNFQNYITDYWNYVDLVVLLSCYFFLIVSINMDETVLYNTQWNIFIMTSMLLTCLRGFSYFRVFGPSAHLIQMSIKMIQYSLMILFFIGYFVVCFAVMISKSLADSSYMNNLYDFYNMIFGNLPEDMQDKSVTYQIMTVLASLIIPIFFINLLIAKLSSSFNELENRQKVLEFIEKASSMFEFESVGKRILKIWRGQPNKNPNDGVTPVSSKDTNYEDPMDHSRNLFPNIYLAVDKSEIFEEDMKTNSDKLLDVIAKQQSKNFDFLKDKIGRIEEKISVYDSQIASKGQRDTTANGSRNGNSKAGCDDRQSELESKIDALISQQKYLVSLFTETQKASTLPIDQNNLLEDKHGKLKLNPECPLTQNSPEVFSSGSQANNQKK